MVGIEPITLQSGFSPVSSSNQLSAVATASLQPSPQGRRAIWPFAAMLVCASLLGIGLAYGVRTLLPGWTLEGGIASLLPNDVVCSNGNSSKPTETVRGEK
jgi:hypothetical protein